MDILHLQNSDFSLKSLFPEINVGNRYEHIKACEYLDLSNIF